jgi:hypothetical protein
MQYHNSLNSLDLCHVCFVYDPRTWGRFPTSRRIITFIFQSLYNWKRGTYSRNLNTSSPPPGLSVIVPPLKRTLPFIWRRTAASRCLLFPFGRCMWTLRTLCYLYSDSFETVAIFVFKSAHIYKDVTPDWTEERSLSREDSSVMVIILI